MGTRPSLAREPQVWLVDRPGRPKGGQGHRPADEDLRRPACKPRYLEGLPLVQTAIPGSTSGTNLQLEGVSRQ